MKDIITLLTPTIVSAVAVILGTAATYAALLFKKYVNTKMKREIVQETVKYVEQVGKLLGSEEKKAKAIKAASEWMAEQGLTISEIQLNILIEATVQSFNKEAAKTEVVAVEPAAPVAENA